jgi:hypothetical protein
VIAAHHNLDDKKAAVHKTKIETTLKAPIIEAQTFHPPHLEPETKTDASRITQETM